MSKRNMQFVVKESLANYRLARSHGLIHNHIHHRDGKNLSLDNGKIALDFINCSYLGLDLHPKVVQAYRSVPPSLGVNFCCARTRLTEKSLESLEERLSDLFQGRAITFPTVTATHMSIMPLIASGILIDHESPPTVHMVFDKFAHASMRFLMPILEKECRISVIGHNDFNALVKVARESRIRGETVVYVADGIYSMGGVCPISELLEISKLEQFYLYIDDAHGTSIFGDRGEGPALAQINGKVPNNLFVTFSMTKGFGVAGGGVIVSENWREELIRSYGIVYAFSAPLDFSATLAAHAALDLHLDGTVGELQKSLRRKVALFDSLMGKSEPFSPIRMIKVGSERKVIEVGKKLLEQGFFTVAAFFPVVARGDAQLRICLSVQHKDEEIVALTKAINNALESQTPVSSKEFAYAL